MMRIDISMITTQAGSSAPWGELRPRAGAFRFVGIGDYLRQVRRSRVT
jgi:hypothetical protein